MYLYTISSLFSPVAVFVPHYQSLFTRLYPSPLKSQTALFDMHQRVWNKLLNSFRQPGSDHSSSHCPFHACQCIIITTTTCVIYHSVTFSLEAQNLFTNYISPGILQTAGTRSSAQRLFNSFLLVFFLAASD